MLSVLLTALLLSVPAVHSAEIAMAAEVVGSAGVAGQRMPSPWALSFRASDGALVRKRCTRKNAATAHWRAQFFSNFGAPGAAADFVGRFGTADGGGSVLAELVRRGRLPGNQNLC